MEIPNAYVLRITPSRDNPQVVNVIIQCPHCYKEHHHGGSVDQFPDRFGHRGARCMTRTDQTSLGYVIRWSKSKRR